LVKKQKITQAIILAAGFGVRMRPLTLTTPKPLVKLKNKPLIFYILEELKKNKIKKCFINVHYLSLKIKKYIDEYKKTNQTMEIIIIKEEVILDTETTGLSIHDGHRIVEIGCIELDDLTPTKNTFHCYLNPERRVSEKALEVHGYTDEFLSKQKKK
jgi:DNA polymerase III alpha subunit (gram-positive type)